MEFQNIKMEYLIESGNLMLEIQWEPKLGGEKTFSNY